MRAEAEEHSIDAPMHSQHRKSPHFKDNGCINVRQTVPQSLTFTHWICAAHKTLLHTVEERGPEIYNDALTQKVQSIKKSHMLLFRMPLIYLSVGKYSSSPQEWQARRGGRLAGVINSAEYILKGLRRKTVQWKFLIGSLGRAKQSWHKKTKQNTISAD